MRNKIFAYTLGAILLGIILFARFWHLGTHPQGLTKDEAYYGYDAYSIMQTGKDIWGKSYPLVFKSTGEYKLNLVYLIIPAIKLFDLTETAVRLPSALFGFGTILVLFFTLQALKLSRISSALLAFSFALSPWALGMSRLFYESNVGLFFVSLGLLGLLKIGSSSQVNKIWWYVSPVALALSTYLYGPYRYISMSIILLWLLITYFNKKTFGKSLVRTGLIYLLICLPILLATGGKTGLTRLTQEWQLRLPGYTMDTDYARASCYLGFNKNPLITKVCYVFWNKPISLISAIATSGLKQLSPDYLFFVGSNSYILPEDQGAYLSYLFPLYLLGIVALVKRFSQSPSSATLILFSLLSAVAVVVITGTVEIYRNPVGLYLVFIIFAFGWELASKYLNKLPKLISIVILVSFLGLAGFQHTKYLLDYFLIYPQSLPLVFGPDTKEIYDFVGQKKDYNLIVDRVYFGPIFAAYYWKLDPRVFQAETEWSQPDPWGWVNPHRLGGIYHGAFGVEELLCRKRDNPEVPIKAIVISDPIPSLGDKASLAAYDASHALRIHEVYDIDELYERLKRPGPCNPK